MALISAFQQGFVPGLIYLLSLMLAMCIAVSFHEYAHAFVANKLGDPTAKNMGRMTLDPTKHIDLIGLLCFVLLGIGWAKPVIVNSRNLKHFKRDDILISIAGPVMNLLLSFIFYGIWFFGTFQWSFAANDVVQQILSMLFSLNICFAVFNILPIPPLDGFHVATSLFCQKELQSGGGSAEIRLYYSDPAAGVGLSDRPAEYRYDMAGGHIQLLLPAVPLNNGV